MKTSLSCLILAGLAAAASAQTASKTKPASCQPAPELEIAFQMKVHGLTEPIKFAYSGCAEDDRNDLQSGYTERSYEGTDGYSLTIVTNHGDGAYAAAGESAFSEVLVSKDGHWVGRLESAANADIVSGRVLAVKSDERPYLLSTRKTPSTFACEAKLPKASYGANQLWLLTQTKAYFFRQDCDICAELDSCDLATQAVKAEIVSHSVSCSDLEPYRKGQAVVYDACAK